MDPMDPFVDHKAAEERARSPYGTEANPITRVGALTHAEKMGLKAARFLTEHDHPSWVTLNMMGPGDSVLIEMTSGRFYRLTQPENPAVRAPEGEGGPERNEYRATLTDLSRDAERERRLGMFLAGPAPEGWTEDDLTAHGWSRVPDAIPWRDAWDAARIGGPVATLRALSTMAGRRVKPPAAVGLAVTAYACSWVSFRASVTAADWLGVLDGSDRATIAKIKTAGPGRIDPQLVADLATGLGAKVSARQVAHRRRWSWLGSLLGPVLRSVLRGGRS